MRSCAKTIQLPGTSASITCRVAATGRERCRLRRSYARRAAPMSCRTCGSRSGFTSGPSFRCALLTMKWSAGEVFVAAAAAALCAALAAFSLGRLAGLGGSGKDVADSRVTFEPGMRPSTTAGG